MGKAVYLFSDLSKAAKALRGKPICLFLDYDGTLAPIVRVPGRAAISAKTKGLLSKLSGSPDCKVAIVSGRELKDLSKHVGLKGVVYVGNHGFEAKGPRIDFKKPLSVRYKKTLKEIKGKLKDIFSFVKGVLIEDKGFSLSVHYRLAGKESIPAIKRRFYDTISPYESGGRVRVRPGKMILEVRPPADWNKGKIVSWLLKQRLFAARNKGKKPFPVYIGDDTTDEDAFEFLRDKGMTIFVGSPEDTKARFYLKDTLEVTKFLKEILKNINRGTSWRKKR